MAAVMVSPDRASAERRFFTGMALAILATVIVGFSRSFFLRPLFPEWPSPSATVHLATAAIARWPGVLPLGLLAFFGLTDLFVIALAIWDFRSRGRLHPVTLWGGLLIIVSQPLRLAVSSTQGWLVFAQWATGLLG